jgi:hypothetical protein
VIKYSTSGSCNVREDMDHSNNPKRGGTKPKGFFEPPTTRINYIVSIHMFLSEDPCLLVKKGKTHIFGDVGR